MTAAEPGRRVAGRYHLIEPIGRGGMGIVWRAHDELLDRPVAVKEVRYNGASGDELADLNRRTMREARAAGRLTHPNVVVVHDVIEEDGRPWIVMQLVPSRSLGQVIREDGPLPPERVAEIGLEVLKALRNAHAMGVLHRDVKPENVLLADDGRVVLTDFGIARVETDSTMTRTGLVGTPAFMPPERLRGGPAQRESDLWSLGATLYAAVEGRPPHDKGAPLPTMHAVLMDEPEPAVHAGRLAPLIEGLLRKDPEERPGYDQIERMLRRALRPDPMPPPPAASRSSSAIPQTGDSARPALGEAGAASAGSRPGAGASAGAAGGALPETGQSLAVEAKRTGKADADGAGAARDGHTRPKTRPSSGAGGGEEGAGRSAAASPAARAEPAGDDGGASAEPDAGGSGARSDEDAAKPGTRQAGTAKPADAADPAPAASGTAQPPASGGEPLGPEDPTLPKNPKAVRTRPAGKASAGPAAGKGGEPSTASPEAPAAAEKAGEARAKPAGKDAGERAGEDAGKDAEPSLADTTRTQKISSWALDMLRPGRDSAAKPGQAGAERRLGAFEATVSIAKPAARLGAFAPKTDEAGDPAADAGDAAGTTVIASPLTAGSSDARKGLAGAGGTAAEAGSGASGAEGPADEGGEAAPDAAERDAAGSPERDGAAGGPEEAARPATLAEAVRSTRPAGSPARDADEAAGSAAGAAGEPEDMDPVGSTRRLHEWPVLTGLDEADGKAADREEKASAAGGEDEGLAAAGAKAAAAKADPDRGAPGTTAGDAAEDARRGADKEAAGDAGKGPADGTADAARDGDRPAKRPRRISPFPPPYSRPTPQPAPRFSPEPDAGRPRGPQPAMAASPAAWQPQGGTPATWQGGLSALIANPTVKIILVAVPALVAVAVIAALLGMRDAQNDLSRQPGDSGGSSAPATPAPENSRAGGLRSGGSSGTGTGQSGGANSLPAPPSASAEPSPGASSAAATPDPEPSGSKSPAKAADKLPKGWRWYTDPTGFSVGLPKGWGVDRRRGTQVFFRGGERSTFLLIDQTNHPKSDAKRDWLAQEKSARYRFSGYKRVRIESVDYFKTAADWEWTYRDGGIRLHVINRGFVTDKRHGYAIYWSTPHKRWKKNLHYFKGFVATFKPAR